MDIEDVVFLGAGASASDGAPLQRNLFREYFLFRQSDSGHEISQDMEDRLAEFFEAFFGLDVRGGNLQSLSFPTFEEILGMLELALNRDESFKGYSLTPANPRIQRVREDLIFLIAIILDRKLRGAASNHKALTKRLKRDRRLLKTAFVSLNYDILIDNALADLHPHYHLDYGVEFTNFRKRGGWKRPAPQKAVCLYKLHGSLNWLYCPTCIALTLTPQAKRVATLVFRPQVCEVCGGEMVPIVIPPTFFKVMSNIYLQEIWHNTEQALTQADRIFFCGYSFPDADIHVKYLLKRVETARSSTPEIFVISNHEGKSDHEKQEEELRYKRFFKDSSRVHYTNRSFEEFSARGSNG